jgi:hypothetical protein
MRFVFPIPFPIASQFDAELFDNHRQTDGRKKKREALFVPPSLFLVAFEDDDDFDKD